jgi:hypothetical protein
VEPTLADRPCRRFGLGDGLILLAALAFTLFALRESYWFLHFPSRLAYWWEACLELAGMRAWSSGRLTRRKLMLALAYDVGNEVFFHLFAAVLFALAMAQPLLRLRRPRPPLRQIIRQSGLAACLGVMLMTLFAVDISWWIKGWPMVFWLPPLSIVRLWPILGMFWSLILLWVILGLFPWRCEATWIDHLGRAVGWGCIVATWTPLAMVCLARLV